MISPFFDKNRLYNIAKMKKNQESLNFPKYFEDLLERISCQNEHFVIKYSSVIN